MIDPVALFLSTLEDIERRLESPEPYERLMLAGLLRKLFFDDFPLVDQINRVYRVKLLFESVELADPRLEQVPPTIWSVQDGIDPDTAPPFRKRVAMSRDSFFSMVVSVVDEHAFSIRDTILFEANIAGAVHAGAPRTSKEEALAQVERELRIGGYAMCLRQLSAISRVCLKALAPLRAAAHVG